MFHWHRTCCCETPSVGYKLLIQPQKANLTLSDTAWHFFHVQSKYSCTEVKKVSTTKNKNNFVRKFVVWSAQRMKKNFFLSSKNFWKFHSLWGASEKHFCSHDTCKRKKKSFGVFLSCVEMIEENYFHSVRHRIFFFLSLKT